MRLCINSLATPFCRREKMSGNIVKGLRLAKRDKYRESMLSISIQHPFTCMYSSISEEILNIMSFSYFPQDPVHYFPVQTMTYPYPFLSPFHHTTSFTSFPSTQYQSATTYQVSVRRYIMNKNRIWLLTNFDSSF